MRAAMANEASAALAAGLDPNAVEGYVPRNSPGTAAATAPQAKGTTKTVRADTATPKSSAPRTMEPGPAQSHSSAGPAEQHNIPVPALPQTAQDNDELGPITARTSETKGRPSQSSLNGVQHVSATSGSACEAPRRSRGAEEPPQDIRKLAKSLTDSGGSDPEGGLQQPAEGMQRSALADSATQESTMMETVLGDAGASHSTDPAQQPVLVCS